MPKIYIVEDDDNIRDLVLYALKTTEYTGCGFESPADFWAEIDNELPDLVLLDIMLPEEDGISILNKLKANVRTADLPVIMLTAKNSEYDRVKGFDCGADDYVTKPFSVLELVLRIKAVLRRSGSTKEDTGALSYANVRLNAEKHTVTVDGENVNLTFKEFELLELLLKNAGIVLSRDRIMSCVWGIDFEGESRTVDMHIKTLRQKLKSGGDIIKTVRGLGYKLGDD